jgi:hypothetical protein
MGFIGKQATPVQLPYLQPPPWSDRIEHILSSLGEEPIEDDVELILATTKPNMGRSMF